MDGSGSVLERSDYYAFGFRWNNANSQVSNNRFLYNGKELQTTGGLDYLDYGARMYDARKGRWDSPDPLGEGRPAISLYAFCSNSPVVRFDPDGMWDDWVRKNKTGEYEWMDDVISLDTTPEGYSYVGKSGSDILADLNLRSNYAANPRAIGVSMWGESTSAGGALMVGVSRNAEISRLDISAEIRYGQKTENNKQGLYLEGIKFEGTRVTMDKDQPYYPSFSVYYGGQDYFAKMKEPIGAYVRSAGAEVYTGSVIVPAKDLNRYDSFSQVRMSGTSAGGNIHNSGNGRIIFNLPKGPVFRSVRP